MSKKNETSPLEARVEALEEIVSDQATTQPASATFVNNPKAATAGLPSFSLGGKNYRFKLAGFRIVNDEIVYAAEAVNDPELLARIVREYPGTVD